jgi:glycerol-3-phosphate acyltransferase PlsY
MMALLMTIIGFLLGSIPFSVLLGKVAGGGDIRRYGDANPGAANVLRAAGWGWALTALLLDGFKGAIPVGVAWFVIKISGPSIIPVAVAPVLGHAFSPWLRFRGGKAVAVTFGIWTGLTLGVGPIVLGMLLGLGFATLASSGWAVMLAMTAFGVFIVVTYGVAFPEWIGVWALNIAILIWMHRLDLPWPPKPRPWITEGRWKRE